MSLTASGSPATASKATVKLGSIALPRSATARPLAGGTGQLQARPLGPSLQPGKAVVAGTTSLVGLLAALYRVST